MVESFFHSIWAISCREAIGASFAFWKFVVEKIVESKVSRSEAEQARELEHLHSLRADRS